MHKAYAGLLGSQPKSFQREDFGRILYLPYMRGPQYRPQYTIVLIVGTPKKVSLILGNPHFEKLRHVNLAPGRFGTCNSTEGKGCEVLGKVFHSGLGSDTDHSK